MLTGVLHRTVKRRDFILASAVTAATLAACERAPSNNSPPPRATPSAPASPAAPASPSAEDMARFLAVSSVLTGFSRDSLDPTVAAKYLDSLRRHHSFASGVQQMYLDLGLAQKTPPPDLDARLVALLRRRSERRLADRILEHWYSGLYDTADGTARAAYAQALGWQSVRWTFAPGQCHGYGDWARAPLKAAP